MLFIGKIFAALFLAVAFPAVIGIILILVAALLALAATVVSVALILLVALFTLILFFSPFIGLAWPFWSDKSKAEFVEEMKKKSNK